MLESSKSKNKYKGNFGENLVCKYLIKKGYKIIEKNFECNFGEIDVIFKDKNEIVFAEIKSRLGVNYGFPAESVTIFKRKHIINTSKYYLYIKNMNNINIRFDVIEVYLGAKPKILINHIKNVFW